MKLVILESDSYDRNLLIYLLEQYLYKKQIHFSLQEFSNEKDMFDNVKFQCEQLLCCLINLSENEYDGLLVGQRIRKLNQDSIILFTSSCGCQAVLAYQMLAEGYLLKPVVKKQLEDTLDKCFSNLNYIYKKINIRSEYMNMNIQLKNIMYIEVFNKTCVIHTKKKSITSCIPLVELEKQLKKEGFLRCHKSYLVNMRYIETGGKSGFYLYNKQFIPISRRESLKHREAHLNWLCKYNA